MFMARCNSCISVTLSISSARCQLWISSAGSFRFDNFQCIYGERISFSCLLKPLKPVHVGFVMMLFLLITAEQEQLPIENLGFRAPKMRPTLHTRETMPRLAPAWDQHRTSMKIKILLKFWPGQLEHFLYRILTLGSTCCACSLTLTVGVELRCQGTDAQNRKRNQLPFVKEKHFSAWTLVQKTLVQKVRCAEQPALHKQSSCVIIREDQKGGSVAAICGG